MLVVSDLLDMFVRDRQIEANEATYLINEIVNSITKSRPLEDILVIVSLSSLCSTYRNDQPAISYNKITLRRLKNALKL
jgi:hypothetical protein